MDDIQVNNNIEENLPETEPISPEEEEKIKLKMKKEKQKQRYQKSVKRRKIVNRLMGFVVFCVLLGALSGVSIIKVILSKTDVVLETSDLRSHDSSLIYDDQGEQIAIVGSESRISYPYDSLPQCVVDAFVAVEDSRFFEHAGFDVPRFAKAFLENIKSLSFAQGGSTLTMQVIKNTYFAVDTIAEKGIDRKVQEIYYSLKINKIVSKEKIFELYVNKVNSWKSTPVLTDTDGKKLSSGTDYSKDISYTYRYDTVVTDGSSKVVSIRPCGPTQPPYPPSNCIPLRIQLRPHTCFH